MQAAVTCKRLLQSDGMELPGRDVSVATCITKTGDLGIDTQQHMPAVVSPLSVNCLEALQGGQTYCMQTIEAPCRRLQQQL